MNQTLVARKKYICDHCGFEINSGEKYLFDKGKDPRLDEDDRQIGVEYWQVRFCFDANACIERVEKIE